MESEKRKRGDDGKRVSGRESTEVAEEEVDGKRAEGGESTAVAEEEEVEEFFAILKRIRLAVKYFKKVKGGGSKVTTGNQWRPSFVLEDFDGDKNQEDSQEDKGLDLNLKPAALCKQDN